MNGSRITRHSSLVRAGWKQALVALAVLASCAGGLVMDAHAILKTCKLTVASPAAETVTHYNVWVGVGAPPSTAPTAVPINQTKDQLPAALFMFGMDQVGTTYQVQVSAINAHGQGPRSPVLTVPIDDGTVMPPPPPAGPVPTAPTVGIACP